MRGRPHSTTPRGWEARAEMVLELLSDPRPIGFIMRTCNWHRETTRKVLEFLREAGKAEVSGKGRYAVWRRVD